MIKIAAMVAFGFGIMAVEMVIRNAKKLICVAACVALLCGSGVIPVAIATATSVGVVRIAQTANLTQATPLSLILLAVIAPFAGAAELVAHGIFVSVCLGLILLTVIAFRNIRGVGNTLVKIIGVAEIAVLTCALLIPYALYTAATAVFMYGVVVVLCGAVIALAVNKSMNLVAQTTKGGYSHV